MTSELAQIERLQMDGVLREFDRQVNTLVEKGYPKIAGLSHAAFSARLSQLKTKLNYADGLEHSPKDGKIAFCVIFRSSLIRIEHALSLVSREGKAGIVSMDPAEPEQFQPITSIRIPGDEVYLLIDFDRGSDSLNVAPQEALKVLSSRGRLPLTIWEGVAILTHFPECLVKNNCFSLLGSRRGDRRVPALWISEKRPKLGWCWDGNPHTWLGSASCSTRIG